MNSLLQKDLQKLSKSIKLKSISNRIDLIAMNFDSSFIQWIKGAGSKDLLNFISNPVVIESIKFLIKIKEDHPEGVSKADFVKYFVGSDNSKYLPTILSFTEINKSGEISVLRTFSDILDKTDVFDSVGYANTESVKNDLLLVEQQFKDALINRPPGGKTVLDKKLTKNEKKKRLFYYLIDNVSNKLSNVLTNFGFDEIANKIKGDRTFLVDSSALLESKLVSVNKDYTVITLQAQKVAKTILKRLEPSDNEYNYNLLVNSAMKFNNQMESSEYDRFFYQLMMQQAKGEFSIERFNFEDKNWIHPNFVAFVSLVLIMIMSQVKFN